MLVTRNQSKHRSAEAVELWNYLTAESGTSISVAYAELNGNHPESISPNTDRCYIFLSGMAKMNVEDNSYSISSGDVVYVERGKRHSMEGQATYYVINNPPFQRK